jgi:hypothetical protein
MDYTTTTWEPTSTTTVSMSDSASGALVAISLGFMLFMVIFAVAIYAINSWFLSGIFHKAGLERWKAWVPFYNMWVLLQLGGKPGPFIFFNFIPFVGSILYLVFQIIAAYNINKKLGRVSGGWTVLFVLVEPVWAGINGLDGSTWDDSKGDPSLAPEHVAARQTATAQQPPVGPLPPAAQPPVPPTAA